MTGVKRLTVLLLCALLLVGCEGTWRIKVPNVDITIQRLTPTPTKVPTATRIPTATATPTPLPPCGTLTPPPGPPCDVAEATTEIPSP